MGKQKHDAGYRKRQLAEHLTGDEPDVDTDEMARRLVKRGLAQPTIFGGERRRERVIAR